MITREEMWLSAIVNRTECNLVPITRKERYYAAILGSGTYMLPITREETYLYAIANGQSVSLPPVTRIEMYLYAVANGTECGLQPITRLERLLSAWTEAKPFTIEDKTPYILRQTAGGVSVGKRKQMTIVGGTLAWNQLVDTEMEAVTTISGRKYLTRIGGTDSIITGDGTDLSVTGGTDNVFDLTLMFGATVAAQMTAAKFRALFPDDYYAYNAGELMSVKTSEHITTTSYPLDSDLELRGLPKLDADNGMYYDGDVYEADGKVTRKYKVLDMGTLNWSYNSSYKRFEYNATTGIKPVTTSDDYANIICPIYLNIPANNIAQYDKAIAVNTTSKIRVRDTSYDGDTAAFKAAMSKVYLVYEAATTPPAEQADPYAETMAVDPSGTEEFVDSRSVKIPVGQDTLYQEP